MLCTDCINLADHLTEPTSSKFRQRFFFSKLHGYTSDISITFVTK